MIFENSFTPLEIVKLSSLIGQKYLHFGSGQMSPWLQSDEVILTTESESLSLQAHIRDEDFEGYGQTYSLIRISEATTERLKSLESSGKIHRNYSGEVIRDLNVVTETVQMKSSSSPEWEYTTSVAVIVILESGYIAISKLDHHNELLIVTFGSEFLMSELPRIDHHFRDGSERRFTFSRGVSSLNTARGLF